MARALKKPETPRFGIGVDIESVARFRRLGKAFLAKVYTAREARYCRGKKDPAQSLAARYAAKEAVLKAIHSVGAGARLGYRDIEVVGAALEAPTIHINKRGFDKFTIKISLSHAADNAVASALVIAEGR